MKSKECWISLFRNVNVLDPLASDLLNSALKYTFGQIAEFYKIPSVYPNKNVVLYALKSDWDSSETI